MPLSFTPFSATHFGALAAGALCIAVLIALGRQGGRPRAVATGLLAFCCLASYPLSQIAWTIGGDVADLDSSLPLHLCDITAIVAGFALLTRRATLLELCYYWGLAASFQGVITPAISYDFPHPAFISFFIHHFALVGAALYLPLGLGWAPRRPVLHTALRALAWSELYFFTMLPLNFLLGSNFGFLREKPANPTLLDHFGPWPAYLLGIQAAGITAIALLSIPFLRPKGTRASARDVAS